MPISLGFGPFGLISGIGVLEGFTLAVMLIFKHGRNERANRLLAVILVFLALSIASHLFGHWGPMARRIHPSLIAFFNTWNAPLVFLYSRALFQIPVRGRGVTALISAALGSSFMLLVANIALSSASPTAEMARKASDILFIVTTLSFLCAALFVLAKFKKSLGQQDEARTRATWLLFLIAILMGMWVFALSIEIAFRFTAWDLALTACSFIILLIANYGFFRPTIFWNVDQVKVEREPSPVGNDLTGLATQKYKKSGLPAWLALQYREKLVSYIHGEKPFTDPELSLRSLSLRVRIPVHHLSRVINELVGATFYEYMNSLRVEEACRLLSDSCERATTIAEICHRSGFNTISTFNTAFKKITGKTPSQFRDPSSFS